MVEAGTTLVTTRVAVTVEIGKVTMVETGNRLVTVASCVEDRITVVAGAVLMLTVVAMTVVAGRVMVWPDRVTVGPAWTLVTVTVTGTVEGGKVTVMDARDVTTEVTVRKAWWRHPLATIHHRPRRLRLDRG